MNAPRFAQTLRFARLRRLVPLAAALALLLAPALVPPPAAAATPAASTAPARVDGSVPKAAPSRGWHRVDLPESASYAWYYLPAAVQEATPLPVVLFLHGSGASPEVWRPFLDGPAEETGVVVIAPAPSDFFGWGIADDTVTLAEALDRVGAALGATFPLDPRRVGLAGHSAGGAYAYFVAYETAGHYAGVASFSAPFRHILGVADPHYAAPLLLWYGTADPNYAGGHFTAIAAMVEHRGIPWHSVIVPGLGHSDIRAEDLVDAFSFLSAQRYPAPNALTPKWAPKQAPKHLDGAGL